MVDDLPRFGPVSFGREEGVALRMQRSPFRPIEPFGPDGEPVFLRMRERPLSSSAERKKAMEMQEQEPQRKQAAIESLKAQGHFDMKRVWK